MVPHPEAAGQGDVLEPRDRAGRPELEHALTGFAAEMVVMAAPGHLIAGALAGQVDRYDLPGLLEGAQIAVHVANPSPACALRAASNTSCGVSGPGAC